MKHKTFADLIANFNQTATADRTSAAFATALTDLSNASAFSVIRKVADPQAKTASIVSDSGCNPAILALRRDMVRDRAYLDRLANASANATAPTYNGDGDPVVEVVDPDLYKAYNDLIHQSLGDGLDLVHDATIAILDEMQKQLARDPDMPIDLERKYTVRHLKRKVWIKTADSIGGWETVETTPIQEVYKAIRRSIQASRHVHTDPRNGYLYLEDLAQDPDSETETVIYRRLAKWTDMGSDGSHDLTDRIGPAGLDGKPTLYSVDRETVDQTDRLVESMNLTTKQATVLKYRLSGYGNKAIATAMGVTENSVKGAMNEIRRKAKAIGLNPDHDDQK